MPKRPFVAGAHVLLHNYKPRCSGFTFDPQRPLGAIREQNELLLNLGVAGVLMLLVIAEEVTERDIDTVFHDSWDRQEYWRWASGFKHSVDGTAPNCPEQGGLKMGDEQANRELYVLLGIRVP